MRCLAALYLDHPQASSPAVLLGGCGSPLAGVAVCRLVMTPPRAAAVLLVTLLQAERRQVVRAASALGGEWQDRLLGSIANSVHALVGKLVWLFIQSCDYARTVGDMTLDDFVTQT